MHAFGEQIGRDMPPRRGRRCNDGGIIADTLYEIGPLSDETACEGLNQSEFLNTVSALPNGHGLVYT